MLKFPTYKLGSTKFIAFAVMFVVMTSAYIYTNNIVNEIQTATETVHVFEIYLDYLFRIFGLFIAGNLVSKIRKPTA